MSDKIVRYYDAAENRTNAYFVGVPLRDLTEDEFEALPKWLQQSVDEAPYYRKTKVPGDKSPAAKAETKPTAEKSDG